MCFSYDVSAASELLSLCYLEMSYSSLRFGFAGCWLLGWQVFLQTLELCPAAFWAWLFTLLVYLVKGSCAVLPLSASFLLWIFIVWLWWVSVGCLWVHPSLEFVELGCEHLCPPSNLGSFGSYFFRYLTESFLFLLGSRGMYVDAWRFPTVPSGFVHVLIFSTWVTFSGFIFRFPDPLISVIKSATEPTNECFIFSLEFLLICFKISVHAILIFSSVFLIPYILFPCFLLLFSPSNIFRTAAVASMTNSMCGFPHLCFLSDSLLFPKNGCPCLLVLWCVICCWIVEIRVFCLATCFCFSPLRQGLM